MGVLSTCCCCCSLEQGCKIIAIVGLVFGGLAFVLACVNADVGYIYGSSKAFAYNVQLGSIVGIILGLVAQGLLLWGTLYDNFIVKRYSQCIIVEV